MAQVKDLEIDPDAPKLTADGPEEPVTPAADEAVSSAGEGGGVSGGGSAAEPVVAPEDGGAASLAEGEALPPSGSTAPAEMT